MSPATGAGSRALLRRLRQVMAEPGDGQQRLDQIVRVIADSMAAEVCSLYLRVGQQQLELCATKGLKDEAVHRARLRVGQGLVGLIAARAQPYSTSDAPNAPGFQYLPEVGEEIYASFCGVPIQRYGRIMGVLVVQNTAPRDYTEDEIDALEVVAMVIAEMAESGQLMGGDDFEAHRNIARTYDAVGAADGAAIGPAHLFEPKLAITQPFTEDIDFERTRLAKAMADMRADVDQMLTSPLAGKGGEYRDVLEAYRMFAHDKGWSRRLDEAVESGVVAEVAVERVQSESRSRMERAANPYLRDRLHDLDDLANRLLRRLAGGDMAAVPKGAILVARHIGPGELLEHGRTIGGIVLEEGGVGSHAAIVARALAIPLVVGAHRVVAHTENGDEMIVDGDMGTVFLRPDESVLETYRAKVLSQEAARARYRELRDEPADTKDGQRLDLQINAGLLSDMKQVSESGASGVGLFRTELEFLTRSKMPKREDLIAGYRQVLDSAKGAPVTFRTLDIGSDKVLPYMKRPQEDNPAMGWRAVRVGLDHPMMLKLQIRTMLQGAGTRPIRIMFPFIADENEFFEARKHLFTVRDWLQKMGHETPSEIKIGAMLETPSIAYASDRFFREVDFISVGGNDLLQFFYAADRGNELVRRRYDVVSPAFLSFLRLVVARCEKAACTLSFCGEAAGRPVDALALAAIGFRTLSMRPVSIGPVKAMLRRINLSEATTVLEQALAENRQDLRAHLAKWLEQQSR
ncbi:MAG: phosphoenolpyruvate--protein phosphotransferase [Pikeienuella sp.]